MLKYTNVLKHKNIIIIKTKLKYIHASLEVSVVCRVGGDSFSSKYTASYVATVSTDRLIFAEIVDLLQKVSLVLLASLNNPGLTSHKNYFRKKSNDSPSCKQNFKVLQLR